MTKREIIRDVLCCAFFAAITAGEICYFIHVLTTTPIMHKSLVTRECLFIETPEGNRPCRDADKIGTYVESWQH